MCFVFFCFCDTCNSYRTKCVEYFIFIISFIAFVLSVLAFFFINRDHLRFLCFILLLVLILFSFIILFCICLILLFRYKQTINNAQNKPALILSIVGLLITIIYFICMISEISLIHAHYQDLNFPCLNIKRDDGTLGNNDYEVDQETQEYCARNRNYNTHKIKINEFLIAYGFALSLLVLMFSLIYSWFNEYRRIKYLIDGPLHDFSIQKNKKDKNIDDEEEENNEEYNNKDIKGKKESNNNNANLGINTIYEVGNNISKNVEKKNILDNNKTGDGIIINSDKDKNSISIEQSSDVILAGNYNKKATFKKRNELFDNV